MAEVAKTAKCSSYVSSGGGDTLRVDLGSEDYVIILSADGKKGVDIDFRKPMVTVYDDTGGWILRQIGRKSGKGFTYRKYSEFEIKTEKPRSQEHLK